MDMERMIQEAYDNGYLRGYEKGKADRPQGEWIDAGTDLDGTHYYRCSNCGWEVETDYPNCPYCIAKMKGADDGRHDI